MVVSTLLKSTSLNIGLYEDEKQTTKPITGVLGRDQKDIKVYYLDAAQVIISDNILFR